MGLAHANSANGCADGGGGKKNDEMRTRSANVRPAEDFS